MILLVSEALILSYQSLEPFLIPLFQCHSTQVVLVVRTIQSAVLCPRCHQLSSRVHSRYQRTVADLSPFCRFAKRLREDYDAVKAGVTLPWSNGQTEGQINRLKMLKRQMFGRAGMDLLSRRFLNAV